MKTHPLVASLRSPAAELLDLVAAAEARYCLGESPAFEPGKIYATRPDVIRPETVTELTSAGLADRVSRPFIGLVVQALIEARTDPLRARIADREQVVAVTDPAGGRMSMARARRLAAGRPETPRELRQAYDRDVAPLWLELYEARLGVIRAAGYTDLADYAARVKCHDLGRLASEARAFLGSTRTSYDAIRRLAAGTGAVTVAGLIGAVRTTFTSPVDLATCLPLLRDVVTGLGLELAPRVRLDLGTRPGKVPGAYCLPVRVPEEIIVAVSGPGGVGDCRALFHEAGHALHFSHTDAGLPVDGRRMGDEGLVEGWGVVTENLFLHRGWLARSFPAGTAAALVRDTARRLLIVARAQCVRLLYAVEAAHGPGTPTDLRHRYEQLMTEHLGARPGLTEHLDVLCGDFAAATRLRSWMFGTALADLMAHEVGPEWPGDPRAGRWLRDRWRHGVSLTAAEALDRWAAPPASLRRVASTLADGATVPA